MCQKQAVWIVRVAVASVAVASVAVASVAIASVAIAGGVALSAIAPARAQPASTSPETWLKQVLSRIKDGRETVPEAWRKSEMDEDLTLAALGNKDLVNAGIALPSGDMELARALASEFIARRPEMLKDVSKFSGRAVIHLANYLKSRGDARCVALYEDVLRRKTKIVPYWDDDVDATLYNLSVYYQSKGQLEKALETEQRIYDYTSFPGLLSNYDIGIGRLLERMGRTVEAEKAYAKSEERGDVRAIGVSRMDRSGRLFSRGKTEEARALLLQPFPGEPHPPIEIALLTRVAESYWDEGDLDNAQKYITQAVTQLKALPAPSDDPYLVAYGPQAESLAARIETQLKRPFFWEKESVVLIMLSNGELQPQQLNRLTLRFKTAPAGVVTFACNNLAVSVVSEALKAPGQDPLKRVVSLRLDADAFKQAVGSKRSLDVVIMAHVADFPNQPAFLRVTIYLPKKAAPSPEKAGPNPKKTTPTPKKAAAAPKKS